MKNPQLSSSSTVASRIVADSRCGELEELPECDSDPDPWLLLPSSDTGMAPGTDPPGDGCCGDTSSSHPPFTWKDVRNTLSSADEEPRRVVRGRPQKPDGGSLDAAPPKREKQEETRGAGPSSSSS
mmetsp:Transcript_42429/g.83367  ORF Transcript_42429/g.83367 Transcript_42429/m.83367 type:complete len:126 (-) Transcript_42429:809-1186(-)